MPMCITGLLVVASSFSAKCVCSIGRIGVKEGTRRRNGGSPSLPVLPQVNVRLRETDRACAHFPHFLLLLPRTKEKGGKNAFFFSPSAIYRRLCCSRVQYIPKVGRGAIAEKRDLRASVNVYDSRDIAFLATIT